MLETYAAFFADKEWTVPQFGGGILPAYEVLSAYDDPNELTLEELRGLNPAFDKDYASYNDAAIVVVGRIGGTGTAIIRARRDVPPVWKP
jgi:beta-glucosidase